MPYRCQKCMNTFKTLTLYNKHAAGPASSCQKVEVKKSGPVPSSPAATAAKRVVVQQCPADSKRQRPARDDDTDIVILDDSKPTEKVGSSGRPLSSGAEVRPYTVINLNLQRQTVQCTECTATFDSKAKLEAHVKTEHEAWL